MVPDGSAALTVFVVSAQHGACPDFQCSTGRADQHGPCPIFGLHGSRLALHGACSRFLVLHGACSWLSTGRAFWHGSLILHGSLSVLHGSSFFCTGRAIFSSSEVGTLILLSIQGLL